MCANIIHYTYFSNLEFQDPIAPVKEAYPVTQVPLDVVSEAGRA